VNGRSGRRPEWSRLTEIGKTCRGVTRLGWQRGAATSGTDQVATETPVALVYNGISHVVMMATPADLEDFALGFSLSEGILGAADELLDLHIDSGDTGIELQLTIAQQALHALKQRRRNLAGRTGCGICGAEALEQVMPQLAPVTDTLRVRHSALQAALEALQQGQPLQAATGGVHAAAWCNTDGAIMLLREDVGRHNALDKVLGARSRAGADAPGFLVVTSRASYEMVAKTAAAGVELLLAVSAPTTLAIDLAQRWGVTLAGFARPGRHTIYTSPERIREP